MLNLLKNITFLNVTTEMVPQRIDNYLFTKFKKIPKDIIYKFLRKRQIRVNNKRAFPKYKIKIGDIIRIPPWINYQNLKNKKKINDTELIKLSEIILFEDDYLLIINKPSGIAVHGGSGISSGIIEKIRKLRPIAKFLELVHRIDKDTSGALIIAKKRFILNHLHQQLRDKKIKKKYIMLVHGIWPKNKTTTKLPLLKKEKRIFNKQQVYIHKSGKISETHFEIIKYYKLNTLMYAYPITGKTHQIRVHSQYNGCPVVFDNRYGSTALDLKIKNYTYNIKKRLLLHAIQISFIHPNSNRKIEIEAPLDKIFNKYINLIK